MVTDHRLFKESYEVELSVCEFLLIFLIAAIAFSILKEILFFILILIFIFSIPVFILGAILIPFFLLVKLVCYLLF